MIRSFLIAALISSAAIAKPYPAEMQRAFMQNCVGLNRELVAPCRCILTNLEYSIPKKQLEKLLASGTADRDPRVASIARKCSEGR